MNQLTFGDAEYLGKRKRTRREVFLDEMERSQVEDTFSKGVRVWYDYNNMKNFTIENPEKAV